MRELKHVHEVLPRKDHRGVDLISDALPCMYTGGSWLAAAETGSYKLSSNGS
jgi:hypothetical protein